MHSIIAVHGTLMHHQMLAIRRIAYKKELKRVHAAVGRWSSGGGRPVSFH